MYLHLLISQCRIICVYVTSDWTGIQQMWLTQIKIPFQKLFERVPLGEREGVGCPWILHPGIELTK